MIGRTNACGLSDQSWANYIAVRNRTKTTIEAGDIDVSTLTGTNSANSLFINATTLTKAVLDLRLITGISCLQSLFSGCTSLTNVSLNLSSLGESGTASIFASCPINTFTLTGISNSNAWGSTFFGFNPFNNLAGVINLTITVPILPNLYLAVMTSLNLASVVQVLGQLFDYSGLTAHTITFNRSFTGLSQSDYDTMAAAVTTANARNWTVAGLTYSM